MRRLTLDEAIKYIKEVVRKNRRNKEKNTIIIPNSFISSTDCAAIIQTHTHRQTTPKVFNLFYFSQQQEQRQQQTWLIYFITKLIVW